MQWEPVQRKGRKGLGPNKKFRQSEGRERKVYSLSLPKMTADLQFRFIPCTPPTVVPVFPSESRGASSISSVCLPFALCLKYLKCCLFLVNLDLLRYVYFRLVDLESVKRGCARIIENVSFDPKKGFAKLMLCFKTCLGKMLFISFISAPWSSSLQYCHFTVVEITSPLVMQSCRFLFGCFTCF